MFVVLAVVASVVMCAVPASCQLESFMTAFNTATLRNDVSLSMGYSFRVGSSPLTVTALGRPVFEGMEQDHTIRIWQDGITTAPVAMVTVTSGSLVDMVGTTEVKYAMLTSPVTLAAGTVYHIVSREYSGGDKWMDVSALNDYQTDWATVRGFSLCNAFGHGDSDGYPDLADTNYNNHSAYGYPTFFTGSPNVPEPTSMIVLGMATVGLMTKLRRRSK